MKRYEGEFRDSIKQNYPREGKENMVVISRVWCIMDTIGIENEKEYYIEMEMLSIVESG